MLQGFGEVVAGKTVFGKKMRPTGLHIYTDARIMELTARFNKM